MQMLKMLMFSPLLVSKLVKTPVESVIVQKEEVFSPCAEHEEVRVYFKISEKQNDSKYRTILEVLQVSAC